MVIVGSRFNNITFLHEMQADFKEYRGQEAEAWCIVVGLLHCLVFLLLIHNFATQQTDRGEMGWSSCLTLIKGESGPGIYLSG